MDNGRRRRTVQVVRKVVAPRRLAGDLGARPARRLVLAHARPSENDFRTYRHRHCMVSFTQCAAKRADLAVLSRGTTPQTPSAPWAELAAGERGQDLDAGRIRKDQV